LDVFFLDVVFLVLSLSKKDRPVGLRLLSVRLLGGIAHLTLCLIEHGGAMLDAPTGRVPS
jgi:hypothetical protein